MGLGFNNWLHNLYIGMLKRRMAEYAGFSIEGHNVKPIDGSASSWYPLKTIQGIFD